MENIFKIGYGVRRKNTLSEGNVLRVWESEVKIIWFARNDGKKISPQRYYRETYKTDDLELTGKNMIQPVSQKLLNMEIDWSKVKMSNGRNFDERYVNTPTGKGESFVNKGRKMVIVRRFIKSEDVQLKIRGHKQRATKSWFNIDIYMDFGKTYSCDFDHTITSDHYTLPNGAIVSNKWRVYEHFKITNI